MRSDVFIYVQHLLGIGHLRRASLLAKAMDKAGLSVSFTSGGRSVSYLDIGNANLVQLPALYAADNSFKILKDDEGNLVDDNWKAKRRDQLLATFKAACPKVLLLEMFPFGRRQMRFELDPLIELAQSMKIPVLTSVRDILTTHKTPGKSDWIIDRVQKDIDHVLVHGDPNFITLEDSFPLTHEVKNKIIYTGYVVEEPPKTDQPNKTKDRSGVLISAGGGAVALPLARAVIKAKDLSTLKDVAWHLLLGNNLPDKDFDEIKQQAPKGMIVERNRPDFRELLSTAQLSISQAGYNTVLETLMSSTPAIVIPFAADSQSEQTARAERLQDLGVLKLLAEKDLTPESLASAVDKALDTPVSSVDIDVQGTAFTANFIKTIIQEQE